MNSKRKKARLRRRQSDNRRFNLYKKRKKRLTDEQERLLYEVWKQCFSQKGRVCATSSLLREGAAGPGAILRLERLVGALIRAWLFPARAETEGAPAVPPATQRSLEERVLWVQEMESLVWKVVQPYTHDLMDQWSREEILFFFHLLIKRW